MVCGLCVIRDYGQKLTEKYLTNSVTNFLVTCKV